MNMHFPVEISFGSTHILLHTICEIAAFFIGFRYYLFLKKRNHDPIPSDNRIWIIIGAAFGALAGSRLIGGLENILALKNADNLIIYFYSNKTVVGGFLGGLAGVEIMKKVIGEKTSSGDLFAYPMILGLIIGRIGCFSMGVYEQTYGTQTSLFTGMDLGDGSKRHPVSLYEIGFLILLWLSLRSIRRNYVLENGSSFKIFIISYLLFRFLLDFIKPHYNLLVGLSVIQLTCLVGLMYYYKEIINPLNLICKKKPD